MAENTRGPLIDQWEPLTIPASKCLWTKGRDEKTIDLPHRSCEGRFRGDIETIQSLEEKALIAFKYANNPNGSLSDIAGVTDPTGQILGLMPHPERADP